MTESDTPLPPRPEPPAVTSLARPRGRLPALLGLLSANLLPLAGVYALGWSPASLLLLYWLEMGTVVLWSAARAPFAERLSSGVTHSYPFDGLQDKRGSVRPVSWLPPVYVRNAPVALMTLAVGAVVWLPLGVLAVAVTDGATIPAGGLPGVLLGALGVFVSHGVTFAEDYIGGERYRDVSARTATSAAARGVAGLFVVVLVMDAFASADPAASGVTAGLVAVVAGKLLYDLSAFRRDHRTDPEPGDEPAGNTERRAHADADGDDEGFLSRLLADPDRERPEPVAVPDGEPVYAAETHPGAVTFGGVALGGLLGLASELGLFCACVLVLFALVAGPLWGVVAAAGFLVAVGAVAGAGEHLESGAVEYEVYRDCVVARDHRLGEPQWRVDLADVQDAYARTGAVAGRLYGTGTVVLSLDGDWPEHVEYVRDPERFASMVRGGL